MPGQFGRRLRAYWSLTKSLQTALLLATGIAGYLSARCPVFAWQTVLALAASLFLAIAGSTVLNMVYDRDIDFAMSRTCRRPLPSRLVSLRETLTVGLLLSFAGVAWAFVMSPLYGTIVLAGVFFDVVIYTLWLKRRTPWSIVWGGLAGGMPILAGRALGTGQIDLAGLTLAVAVLFWIPTHIVTFSIKYADDYRNAGVPVIPNAYGLKAARLVIAVSTCLAAAAMLASGWLIGIRWGFLYAVSGLGAVLVALALVTVIRASPKLNFALFKMASVYMLASTAVIAAGA
ncbi:MAG: heme o synthase [Chloroflexota bacterium]